MAQAGNQVSDLTPTGARNRPRLALDFNTDREKAFRSARFHSRIVRVMRIVLPVTAVCLFASYGIFVQRSVKISHKKGSFTVDAASISTEALVAHNPKYEGFDKQGGKFIVRAKTAEQDFGQKGPVRLKTIDGQLIDAGKNVTDLSAYSGTLDTKTNVLELYEKIDVVSQNGMTAELTRATVHTKESRITSDQPVTVRMPTGIVQGKTLLIEQKLKQVTFDNGVVARLKQEPAKDKPGAPPQAPKVAAAKGSATGPATTGPATTGPATTGLATMGAGDAPVDITSTKLFIDDNAKQAVFSGNVIAKQADSTLETAQLEVIYEGQQAGGITGAAATDAASDPARAAAKRPPTDAAAASRIKRLVSKTDVVITRGAERVTGRSAEFDAEADRAVLLGNVVIISAQDRQVTADRADLDNKTNFAVLTGHVVITSGLDRRATSDRADMDNKNDTALLTGNVIVTQIKNVLKGRRLYVDRKAGTMSMASPAEAGVPVGRISARMYQADNEASAVKKKSPAVSSAPADTGKADPGKADQAKGMAGFTAMRADPSQPIDIDSEKLDVNDKAKTAIFRGAVHAVQGDYTIRTEELVVTYSGESMALSGDPKPKPVAGTPPAPPGGGTQLQKVEATRKVTVTTKDGRIVSGNRAEFDTKANQITLIGDVQMTQNKSTANGPRAIIDMTTGNMHMDHGGAAVASGAEPMAAGAPSPRRIQILLNPNEVKDKAKADPNAKPAIVDPSKARASSPPVVAQPPTPAPIRRLEAGGGFGSEPTPFDTFGRQ